MPLFALALVVLIAGCSRADLSITADLYGTLVVKDSLVIMHEKMPAFFDIRGFSRVNVGANRVELGGLHGTLANFSDCKRISLAPQMILGVKDTPKVEMKRVTKYSAEGWEVERADNPGSL